VYEASTQGVERSTRRDGGVPVKNKLEGSSKLAKKRLDKISSVIFATFVIVPR
jgi:hypothetical protein